MRLSWATLLCVAAGMGLLRFSAAGPAAAAETRAREVEPQSVAQEVEPGSLEPLPGQALPDGAPSVYAPESAVYEQLMGGSDFNPELARRVLDESDVLVRSLYLPQAPSADFAVDLLASREALLELDTRLIQKLNLGQISGAGDWAETPSSPTSLDELKQLPADSAAVSPGPGTAPAEPDGGYRYWRDEIGGMLARIDSCLVQMGFDDKKRFSKYGPQENDLHAALFPVEDKADFLSRYLGDGNQARGLFEDGCLDPIKLRREWDFRGSIGFRHGQSTFSEEEQQEYSLEQRLGFPSGKEYSFYQRYDVDHSYVASSTLSLGAEQRFPKLLWNGKLRLKEEFRLYDDKLSSLNNRQDGTFQLDFDPRWSEGRWKADVSYKYNIKEYETFSPRSYRQNRTKLKLQRQFSRDLSAGVNASFDDYSYSFGSNRSNTKRELGGEVEWQVNDQLKLSASVEEEEKEYDVRRTRSYEQTQWRGQAQWRPDRETSISLDGSVSDYSAPFSPDRNYEDQSLRLRGQRSFSPRWSADFNLSQRSKAFDIDPTDDLDQAGWGGGLSYNADSDWSFWLNLSADSYDYVNPDRAFDSERLGMGAGYRHGNFNFSADYSLSSSSYAADPGRDYEDTRIGLNAGYQWRRHDLSAYFSSGKLDQADPLSVSDYNDSAYGGRWQFRLSRELDLSLNYDHSTREYAVGDDLKDDRFEARLEFEL